MAAELTPKTCVGKKNYAVAKDTNWYGFNALPIAEDTRCEYCYRHLRMLGAQGNMFEVAHYTHIDCDSMTDPVLSMLEVDGFRLQVTTPDQKVPFLIHPTSGASRRNGTLVVELPEKTKYAITIDPQVSKQLPNSKLYYNFMMKVGDREVKINDGKPIYYRDRTTVHGFSTTDAFEFKAADPSTENLESLPANLVHLEITCFRRTGDHFTKLATLNAKIQLSYINPEVYQTLRHAPELDRLHAVDDSYPVVLQQRRRLETARARGLLPTDLLSQLNLSSPVMPSRSSAALGNLPLS